MDIDVSIVMAYYNRKDLLLNTLRDIARRDMAGVEVIIVDDGSTSKHEISDVCRAFDLSIRIVRIEPEDKKIINPYSDTRLNPCIPFNLGFKLAIGQVIVLQNPECIYVGDVIGHIRSNIGANKYLNYACYSINFRNTDRITAGEEPAKVIFPINNAIPKANCDNAWYNHSKYNPSLLHFCSAMTRDDLYDLGGFDERYSNGLAYDDNDFLMRVQRKGTRIVQIDEPFVIHQAHKSAFSGDWANMGKMMAINHDILQKAKKEMGWDVKKHNQIFTYA